VLRIFAPEEPFQDDDTLKSVYDAFLDAFARLDEPSAAAFQPAHALLQNVATIGLCVPMLDLECPGAERLVPQLFEVLFAGVNPANSSLIEEDATKVLGTMLEEAEEVSPEVLTTILERLVQPFKGENSASHNLACSLVRKSENNLQLAVQHFLVDALSSKGNGKHPLSKRGADVLEALAVVDSTALVTVWPTIMEELQNDDAEPRAKAVKLFGRALATPGSTVAKDYAHYLTQFLRRFGDKLPEIRVEMCGWGAQFLAAGAAGDAAVAEEIAGYLEDRLIDYEEKVRIAAVSAVCDVAETTPRAVDPELLMAVGERMLDKKANVRQLALKRLGSVYRAYVARFAEVETPSEESQRFDWVPSALLRGCAQPDIRHHAVEPVLVDLFSARVSVERRSLFWLQALCKMDDRAAKAFNFMLRAKQAVQTDMRRYLELRQTSRAMRASQGGGDGEAGVSEEEFKRAFAALAKHFPEPGKAAGFAEKLHAMKDGNVFRGIATLLKPETSAVETLSVSQDILKRVGGKHPAHDWMRLLLVKISQQPFGNEHVRKVLEIVVGASKEKSAGSLTSALEHLVQLAHSAPQAFVGTAKELAGLITHRDAAVVTAACRIVASAATCLDGPGVHKIKVCERLKVLCVEGTAAQAKHAARTLAKLAAAGGTAKGYLKDVYERVVEDARDDDLLDSNLPAALATIQVVGQEASGLYFEHLRDIESYIVDRLLARPLPKHASRAGSSVSAAAEMQARGLKALAKGCCTGAAGNTEAAEYVQRVLDVMGKVLAETDPTRCGVGADRTHLRVAAAKATLVVARLHHPSVTPQLFVAVSLVAEEAPETMIAKLQHGIVAHGLHQAYAAPVALVAGRAKGEIRQTAKEALAAIVPCVRRRAIAVKAAASKRPNQDAAALSRTLLTHSPEYFLTYLAFLVSHHPALPDRAVGEEENGAAYRWCQQVMSAAVTSLVAGTSGESVPAAFKILRKLKFVVDATDENARHGLYVLSDIALLAFYKEATKRGWDTGPFPGQVAFPRAFFTLQHKAATNRATEDGGNIRVGDYSHLPVGFEIKTARHTGDHAPRDRKPKKQTTARNAKPVAEPSRTMPGRAARKAAYVDGEEGDYAEEEEQQQLAVLGNELVTPGVAKLVSYGVRNVLELPAPPNWDAGASDDETETQDDETETQDDETEMQEDDDSDSELEIATTKKKKPLGAVNTPPKVSSAGKRGAGKQRKDVVTKENVDDPYDDANLDAPAAKAART
jgi:sister-chromatid-cohesion protein PDS5